MGPGFNTKPYTLVHGSAYLSCCFMSPKELNVCITGATQWIVDTIIISLGHIRTGVL